MCIRPVMTYASPVFAHVRPDILYDLQIVQNKFCSRAADAPWYVKNSVLHRDLELPTISKYMKDASERFFDVASNHSNPLLVAAVSYEPPPPHHFCRRPQKVLLDPPDDLTVEVEKLIEINKMCSFEPRSVVSGSARVTSVWGALQCKVARRQLSHGCPSRREVPATLPSARRARTRFLRLRSALVVFALQIPIAILEHPANNLLTNEVSKKRWLCTKGTPTCSVVLQLARCVQISNLQICSHNASLIEVLVGRSETPDQPFKVLVPSCVFITPSEARKNDDVEKVRSFDYSQLASDTKNLSWDRVRIVCSQPYNKHCKYGLSFIHIFEPEGESSSVSQSLAATTPTPIPPRLLDLDTKSSDEEDNFKPGELFAKYRAKTKEGESSQGTENLSTDAQIRQATAKALKNIPDISTQVVRSPIVKNKIRSNDKTKVHNDTRSDRQRNELLYTVDDEGPNNHIDKLIEQHNKEKSKHKNDASEIYPCDNNRNHANNLKVDDIKHNTSSKNKKELTKTSELVKKKKDLNIALTKTPSNNKKRTILDSEPSTSNTKKKAKISRSRSPHRLLEDVVFVISGYENPRRSNLRNAALAMGARYEKDWMPRCTHLVCAFSNTPKLKTVRASKDGQKAIVVTGEWIEECSKHCRRLPWQWFATEPKLRQPRDQTFESSDEAPSAPDSEMDTDDEIEKVLKEQRGNESKTESPLKKEENKPTERNASNDSDVAFVIDERIKGEIVLTDSDSDITVDNNTSEGYSTNPGLSDLPDLFDGKTFLIDDSTEQAGFDTILLRRYIKAYGGECLKMSQINKDTEVDYVLCGSEAATTSIAGAIPMRADWIWQCHRDRKIASTSPYSLQTSNEGD
ncbi:DNA repair protein XRCC1 [Eumeta japonica]|uniref:DNA repair protein XRCC1 n=1 Tax=Eumeta variegata TaxID=151549 RepID=A0A4C1X720_EUMVA|nr:DNA repair protein XRCC1 [Eumeta japonica]